MTHRTFKADLYDQILRRHQKRIVAMEGVLQAAGTVAPGLGVDVRQALALLQRAVAAAKAQPPGREWEHAVGLTVEGFVGVSSKHGGFYSLSVVPDSAKLVDFKCIITGPKGSVDWWPGCGRSETEVMVSVGAWRHPARRFFGLKARGNA